MTDDSNRQDSVSSGTATGPSPAPVAVSLDKSALRSAAGSQQTQEAGASPWAEAQAAAARAGNAAQNAFQGGVSSVQSQSEVAQKKLVAGLLGIFLGSLGVHKFYLGLTSPGVIMLVTTLVGYFLFMGLFIILVGFIFLLLPAAIGIVGLIEGILYLTKSDADFQRDYLVGKRPWF